MGNCGTNIDKMLPSHDNVMTHPIIERLFAGSAKVLLG